MSDPIDIETLTLKNGSHHSRTSGVCAMEAVAWLAGEKHSDSPACASPVIAAFMRNWNDSLPSDDDRDRLLKPLLPRLIGTAASTEIEDQRSWMAMDWLARECAPAFIALTPALAPHADALRGLAPLADAESLAAARQILAAAREAARDAARAAAGAAARDAAWEAALGAGAAARAAAGAAGDAAWDAARYAARYAAWDAARYAAGAAARYAAWDAARYAAGYAAGAAARDTLKPTVERLRESAQQLVIRMCELTEVSHD